MDLNLMSCPTCGHAVSNTAGACTYCGAKISGGSGKEQADDKIAAEETQSTVSEPSVQPAEMPPADEMSEEAEYIRTAAATPSESILSQATSVEPIAANTAEPATEGEPRAEAPAAEDETELEEAPQEEEQAAAPEPQSVRQPVDSRSNSEIASSEAVEPEIVSLFEQTTVVNLMQEDDSPAAARSRSFDSPDQTAEEQAHAEAGPEEMPVSPAPEVLDLAAEESDESETLGTEIIEMVETLAAEDRPPRPKPTLGRTSSDKAAGASQDDQADDGQPTETQETAAEKKGGLILEALGDTILLEPADEVQTPAKTASDKFEEKMKMDAPKPTAAATASFAAKAPEPKRRPDLLKIEKAAQEMAAAIKEQKEKLGEVKNAKGEKAESAKIQALKKQKAAQANELAKKKQKLLLAKAAALKRKKAAEAKAQALKKQREVPTGSATPKHEKAAAISPRPERTPTAIARNLEANSQMQDLLKKYEGQTIGINYDNSAEIKEALLEGANSEYFSVFVKDKQLHYNYPLKTILTVIEGKEGVNTGSSKLPYKFNAVIKVYPLVLF